MKAALVALGLGRLLVVICSVASVRLYTQALGAHEVGVMNLVLSAVNLFALLSGSIGQFFNRQVLEWKLRGRLVVNIRNYFIFLVLFSALSCALVLVPYLLGDAAWRNLSLPWLLFLLTGTLILSSLNNAVLYIINVTGSRLAYSMLSNLTSWAGLGISIAAVATFAAKAQYWLLGPMIGQMLCLSVATFYLWRSNHPDMRTEIQAEVRKVPNFLFRDVFRFSWPLVICMGLYWMQRSSYAPLMASMNGVSIFGLFSVAFSIGVLAVTSFDVLFKDYYSPIYYRSIVGESADGNVRAWNNYMEAFAPAIVGVFFFVSATGDSLIDVLVSREFRGLGDVVTWGALSQGLIAIYSVYVVLASTFMDNKVLIGPNVGGACVAIALLYTLLPINPVIGTGISISLAILVTTYLTARKLKHMYPRVTFPLRRVIQSVAVFSPLWLIRFLERSGWPGSAAGRASLVIVTAAIYTALVQYLLARSWIYGSRRVDKSFP
jgi:O-antigen/teichoic acid export membrane protein